MTTGTPEDFSLYIHIPWCVRKCPYCDFNSHVAPPSIPYERYLEALIEDLDLKTSTRPLKSIFIGGGTPSLTPPQHVGHLLERIAARYDLNDIEITLEANPGATDCAHLKAYRSAGINRLSIGVQSFHAESLTHLGRIHDATQSRHMIDTALTCFDRINVDLMFGLPEQSIDMGLKDLEEACRYPIEHISWYQLTLEPGTAFARRPPTLPPSEMIETLHEEGTSMLSAYGFTSYEISAFTRQSMAQHNLNYWEGGDYLGIGAGAHSKWTEGNRVTRWALTRYPNKYLAQSASERIEWAHEVPAHERLFDYLLNRCRLKGGSVSWEALAQRNALSLSEAHAWVQARKEALEGYIRHDALGLHFEPKAFIFYRSLMEALV